MSDLSERKYLNEVTSDKEVKAFVDEWKISPEEFEQYLNVFMSFHYYKGLCKDCKGLGECKQNSKGRMPVLEKDDEYISLGYENCAFKNATDQLENIYTYGHPFVNFEGNLFKDVPERKKVLSFIKKFLNSYLDNPEQKGFYLAGPYGCGKSYLLSKTAIMIANLGVEVAYLYYPDFIRRLKGVIKTGEIDDYVDELKVVPVLCLDDFGGESNTDFMRDEVLLPILQYRMEKKLPVFITSNLKDSEIIEHLSFGSKGVSDRSAVRAYERIRSLTEYFYLENAKNYR